MSAFTYPQYFKKYRLVANSLRSLATKTVSVFVRGQTPGQLICDEKAPFILVQSNDGIVTFNLDDADKTEVAYEQIRVYLK